MPKPRRSKRVAKLKAVSDVRVLNSFFIVYFRVAQNYSKNDLKRRIVKLARSLILSFSLE
jgi:predicted site-specific integrase-resolvase